VSEIRTFPEPSRRAEIASLVAMLASVVPDRSAVYVAAPITSGRRFVDWLARRDAGIKIGTPAYESEHRRHVVVPNLAAAAAEVSRLRSRLAGVVIDPTAVEFNGWEQPDYHSLWQTVIERYAGMVVFLKGWEYSVGCSCEFLTALRTGATTLAADLTPLSCSQGVAALRTAATVMQEQDMSDEFFRSVLGELTSYGG
jgi:hypothetical protein